MVVAARNEAERIEATLAALGRACPGAPVWVVDDGSSDATAAIAAASGARMAGVASEARLRRGGRGGKGQAMTLGVEVAVAEVWHRKGDAARAYTRARSLPDLDNQPHPDLDNQPHPDLDNQPHPDLDNQPHPDLDNQPHPDLDNQPHPDSDNQPHRSGHPVEPVAAEAGAAAEEPVLVLCDGDLGQSASELGQLVEAVRNGEADVAIACFSTRAGGGLGFALAFARWAVRRRCGLSLRAPLSGQRALRLGVLEDLIPFAPGYGMEIGMTIDAVRAGHEVIEVELPLSHRPTGRRLAGFLHRARQLADFVKVYAARR